jgi:glutamyl-tRNA synthetase
VIRLKVPLDSTVSFNDAIRGEITYDTNQLDDIVLLKSDGFPTYHLASIVDDHLMQITHVLRGDEWIASTPRHIILYKALGWEPPIFAHMPVILSPSGGKLSKRKGAASVMDYKKEGFLPEALVNFLALLGWNPGDDREILTRKELEELFSLKRVSPKPAVFDEQKLEWMNSQYIMQKSADELFLHSKEFFSEEILKNYDESYIKKVIELMKERVKRLNHFADMTGYFFNELESYNEKAVKKRFKKGEPIKVLETAKTDFENLETFMISNIEKLLHDIAEKLELSMGGVNPVVRLAVTGEGGGPDLADIIELLGKEKTINRIEKAIRWIKENI